MRRGMESALLAILAATVVILVLNHLEADEYPQSSTVDPLGDVPSWLEPTSIHRCPAFTDRTYRFEAIECLIEVTVTDRDGWYRLFWAGPETYRYSDPALVGGALRNGTAVLSGGTWRIRGRYVSNPVPATNSNDYPADPVELCYWIGRGKFPGTGDPVLDKGGTTAVPTRFLWFRYPFPPDRVDDFWWELQDPESFAGTLPIPCPCGRKPAQEQKQER
ncbi:MAG TPA: hypothetical protein VFS19_02475 [Planctomycetota bacterium]|nr:hypothetical protein [Planctomycetota bacterium]